MNYDAVGSYGRCMLVGALLAAPVARLCRGTWRKGAAIGAVSGLAFRALEWIPHDKTVAYSKCLRSALYCAELKFLHRIPKIRDEAKMAVLFIHGDHSGSFTFRQMAQRIDLPMYAIDFNSPAEAGSVLAQLLVDLGNRPVFLVGHSRGASVARDCVDRDQVKGMVSIAGRGSRLGNEKIASVQASCDWQIPADQTLTGPRHTIVPGTGHLSILFSRETEQIVLDEITRVLAS